MKSFLDIVDLTTEELYDLIHTALDIIERPEKYAEACKGKKLATLFFEPSTRTRLSFEAAMYELGGNVLGFGDVSGTSVAKGESLADTAKVISCYADVIAMRHPMEGAPLIAALHADIPVINAGDGGHNHPTQTLADLLTVYREKGTFDNLTVGLCGDLKYGRTVHSLIAALSRYKNIRFVLISPEELRLPGYVKELIDGDKGFSYVEENDLGKAIPELDVLYMTRVQRERFDDPNEYERLKDVYILTEDKLASAKEDMIIMHPMPRVNEISVKVDKDKRACYIKQVANGKYMRMALILKLLEEAQKDPHNRTTLPEEFIGSGLECKNPKCVSHTERDVVQAFKRTQNPGLVRCVYCDCKHPLS